MNKNKNTKALTDNEESNIKESSDNNIQSMTKLINELSTELEVVRKSVEKRKSENTSLKILFYTGLAVLLAGFLYSNSKLQRAHMKSLEKNIISLEQRMLDDMNLIKTDFELTVQDLNKQFEPISTDIYTVLGRMDYAISQIHPKNEQTATLINQVRLNTDAFTRVLKKEKTT